MGQNTGILKNSKNVQNVAIKMAFVAPTLQRDAEQRLVKEPNYTVSVTWLSTVYYQVPFSTTDWFTLAMEVEAETEEHFHSRVNHEN